ncbi:hypothetical protein J3458_000869 [Metarhizium acridum]|uniref:uncharacterized protein n=1 Tax=Metarhizium acridum TaxID=92637 RepID=UPI001C6CD3FE|nr:hypothetical protein J3458_000869 [Metarhizium acridum]
MGVSAWQRGEALRPQVRLMGPVNWRVKWSTCVSLSSPRRPIVMPHSCLGRRATPCKCPVVVHLSRDGQLPTSHFTPFAAFREASPMHLDDSHLGKPLERRHGRGGNMSLS